MKKAKSVVFSILWAVIVIAFPVSSGVIVVISKSNAVNSRLIQAAFMCLSIAVPFLYCKFMHIDSEGIMLKGFDKIGVKTCLYYIPLIIVLLPMIITGVNLSDTLYTFAVLLFTLSVGIAEELYFRGIILRLLSENFSALPAVFIATLIFGIGHVSNAFVESSAVMVLLTVINALLFGWLTTEIALITKNIVPLMIFHCLFDFFTYQMLATGNVIIIIYIVRGTLMTIMAVYLLMRLKKQIKEQYKQKIGVKKDGRTTNFG